MYLGEERLVLEVVFLGCILWGRCVRSLIRDKEVGGTVIECRK
jgi:hypothetical protein